MSRVVKSGRENLTGIDGRLRIGLAGTAELEIETRTRLEHRTHEARVVGSDELMRRINTLFRAAALEIRRSELT